MTACSEACSWCGRCSDRRGDEAVRVAYHCVQPGCGWHSRLALAAYEHHREAHHTIELGTHGVRAQFSCCTSHLRDFTKRRTA
jgi:hypothetical protein